MNCINLKTEIYFIFLSYCEMSEIELIKNYAKYINKTLCKSAETGKLTKLKAVVALGIIPNNNLINYACKGGKLSIVKYLYDIGLKANSATLNLAIICSNSKIVKYLNERGVKPTSKSLEGAKRLSIIEFLTSIL